VPVDLVGQPVMVQMGVPLYLQLFRQLAVAVAVPAVALLRLEMEIMEVPVAAVQGKQVLVERAPLVKEIVVRRDEVLQAPTMAVVAAVHQLLVPVVLVLLPAVAAQEPRLPSQVHQ
jgi:hypothetical protein